MTFSLRNSREHARYSPPSSAIWNGRWDGGENAYFHQIVRPIDLSRTYEPLQKGSFGLIGFCCDEGIRRNSGRLGAVMGPPRLRESLGKFPVLTDSLFTFYDFGDVHCSDGNLEASQKLLGQIISELFRQNIHPLIFGGGHELAWGTYQGIATSFPQSKIGIINFDAHYDVRPLLEGDKGTSGSSFYQIALDRANRDLEFNYLCVGVQQYSNSKQLFERAQQLNSVIIYAHDIVEQGVDTQRAIIRSFIAKCEYIYLTICMDVFDSSACPGVSAPQVLGLHPWHLLTLMREVIDSGLTLCLEIAELSPSHDIQMQSARLGATLACDYVHRVLKVLKTEPPAGDGLVRARAYDS